MTNPKGMRVRVLQLIHSGQLHLYSSSAQRILRLQRSTPTEED